MYKVCEKCGYMYDDKNSVCPQCGNTGEVNNNQETPGFGNNSYQGAPGFGSFSTSTSSGRSSTKSSGGMDMKKLVIAFAAVVVVVALVLGGVFVVPRLLEKFAAKPVGDDVAVGESSFVSESGESGDATKAYMPSCRDWNKDRVDEYFASVDCEIEYSYSFSEDVPENCVIKQSLEPGEQINPGSKIVIEISKGQDNCPYDYQQKIVVSGSGSGNASMELFEWENGDWVSKYSCFATVGKNGIGHNYGEGKGVTPAGTFKLGIVLSDRAISNADWPNRIVTEDTCIVDDASSSYYNTIRNISELPEDVGFDDIGNTIVNGNSDKVMYIEHNGNGIDTDDVVPGNGSAITICGKTAGLYATAGCIDISDDDFNSILSLLDYSMNPHIEITP